MSGVVLHLEKGREWWAVEWVQDRREAARVGGRERKEEKWRAILYKGDSALSCLRSCAGGKRPAPAPAR